MAVPDDGLDNAQVQLPVIDLSNPDPKTADELVSAAATYGFVFIKSNGTDMIPKGVDKTFELVRCTSICESKG